MPVLTRSITGTAVIGSECGSVSVVQSTEPSGQSPVVVAVLSNLPASMSAWVIA